MIYQELLAVASTAVAFLFLYSGAAKLVSLSAFIRSLLLIPYFPHRYAKPVGMTIPLLEMLAAVFLIRGDLWAKLLTIGMLIAFSTIAVIAVIRRQSIACNCFGPHGSEQLSISTILRNLVLAMTTALSIFIPTQQSSSVLISNSIIAFLLYLIISKSAQNHRAFIDATRAS